jgi:hypothetical protein
MDSKEGTILAFAVCAELLRTLGYGASIGYVSGSFKISGKVMVTSAQALSFL